MPQEAPSPIFARNSYIAFTYTNERQMPIKILRKRLYALWRSRPPNRHVSISHTPLTIISLNRLKVRPILTSDIHDISHFVEWLRGNLLASLC